MRAGCRRVCRVRHRRTGSYVNARLHGHGHRCYRTQICIAWTCVETCHSATSSGAGTAAATAAHSASAAGLSSRTRATASAQASGATTTRHSSAAARRGAASAPCPAHAAHAAFAGFATRTGGRRSASSVHGCWVHLFFGRTSRSEKRRKNNERRAGDACVQKRSTIFHARIITDLFTRRDTEFAHVCTCRYDFLISMKDENARPASPEIHPVLNSSSVQSFSGLRASIVVS